MIDKDKNSLSPFEAVQQSKIGRKRIADKLLTPKRRENFGAKTDCATASPVRGTSDTLRSLSQIYNHITHNKK
jgi:hypothetical protein